MVNGVWYGCYVATWMDRYGIQRKKYIYVTRKRDEDEARRMAVEYRQRMVRQENRPPEEWDE
jgi:hypothetical protein